MLSPLPRQRRSLLRPSLTRRVRIPRHIYDPTERARSVSEFNQLPMLATDYGGSSLADALTRRVTSRSIYSIGCLSDRRLRQCGASSATLTCSAIPTRRVSEGRSAADLGTTRERAISPSRELRGQGWMLNPLPRQRWSALRPSLTRSRVGLRLGPFTPSVASTTGDCDCDSAGPPVQR